MKILHPMTVNQLNLGLLVKQDDVYPQSGSTCTHLHKVHGETMLFVQHCYATWPRLLTVCVIHSLSILYQGLGVTAQNSCISIFFSLSGNIFDVHVFTLK